MSKKLNINLIIKIDLNREFIFFSIQFLGIDNSSINKLKKPFKTILV
jgi:hypothetical protein